MILRATRRVCIVVGVVAVLAAAAHAGRLTAADCGTLSLGPGATLRGAQGGPACELRAFDHGCRPARFALSIFGVDTIRTTRFRLVRRGSRCDVDVTSSFAIVPQPPRVQRGRCARLAREHGRIVATGCVGAGLPPVLALTPTSRTG